MKANELRIGNLIYDANHGIEMLTDDDIIKVGGVNGIYNTLYDDIDNIYGLDQVEPIPLNSDRLEKLGFKIADYNENWHNITFQSEEGEAEIALSLGGKRTIVSGTGEDDTSTYIGCKIEFVHQLQNLYHAFTGQELDISGLE